MTDIVNYTVSKETEQKCNITGKIAKIHAQIVKTRTSLVHM